MVSNRVEILVALGWWSPTVRKASVLCILTSSPFCHPDLGRPHKNSRRLADSHRSNGVAGLRAKLAHHIPRPFEMSTPTCGKLKGGVRLFGVGSEWPDTRSRSADKEPMEGLHRMAAPPSVARLRSQRVRAEDLHVVAPLEGGRLRHGTVAHAALHLADGRVLVLFHPGKQVGVELRQVPNPVLQ